MSFTSTINFTTFTSSPGDSSAVSEFGSSAANRQWTWQRSERTLCLSGLSMSEYEQTVQDFFREGTSDVTELKKIKTGESWSVLLTHKHTLPAVAYRGRAPAFVASGCPSIWTWAGYCCDTHSKAPSGDPGPRPVLLSLSNTTDCKHLSLLHDPALVHLNDTAARKARFLPRFSRGTPGSERLYCLKRADVSVQWPTSHSHKLIWPNTQQ